MASILTMLPFYFQFIAVIYLNVHHVLAGRQLIKARTSLHAAFLSSN